MEGDVPGGPVVKTSPSGVGAAGSIPGGGAKIPPASQPKNQNIKQKQYCHEFIKDFKRGPHQKKKKSLKKNKKRRNLIGVLLSERSQSEKARLYDSHSVTFWKRQNNGDSKKISG